MDLKDKILLAPMAGITDAIFRAICKRHGADIVLSEMVSAEGLLRDSAATETLVRFADEERPIGIQLFGSHPGRMADAAARVADLARPDFIDLNSGCPVRKVVRRNGGAALLKDAGLYQRIVSAMVRSAGVPVTVKIRSGWSTGAWVDVEYARIAEQCGAAAVTLHPRSAAMGYGGQADWERIGLVRSAVSLPVIGNGDIRRPEDAAAMFARTGCDAVMIGRGALGNPWVFERAKDVLAGRAPRTVSIEERLAVAREHLAMFAARHGERRAAAEMKKHLAWYTRGLPGAPRARSRIFHAASVAELEGLLGEISGA